MHRSALRYFVDRNAGGSAEVAAGVRIAYRCAVVAPVDTPGRKRTGILGSISPLAG